MSKPPPRKPLFQPPLVRNQPPLERGKPGWLVAIAKDITDEESDQVETVQDKPKAGEKGWLISIAEEMSIGSTSNVSMERKSTKTFSHEGNSQEHISKTKPETDKGVLAENSQNSFSQQSQSSVASSMELLASDSVSSQLQALMTVSSGEVANNSQTPDSGLGTTSDMPCKLPNSECSQILENMVSPNDLVSDLPDSESNSPPLVVDQISDTLTEDAPNLVEASLGSDPDNHKTQDFETTNRETIEIGENGDVSINDDLNSEVPETMDTIGIEKTSNNEKMASEEVDNSILIVTKDLELNQSEPRNLLNKEKSRKPGPISGLLDQIFNKLDKENILPKTGHRGESFDQGKKALSPIIAIKSKPQINPSTKPLSTKPICKNTNRGFSNLPTSIYQPSTSKKAGKESSKSVFRISKKNKKNLKPKYRKKKLIPETLNQGSGLSCQTALLDLQKLRTATTWVKCCVPECGSWRWIQEMDPSCVAEFWECKDNPDPKHGSCNVPEQHWSYTEAFVENRFTVGSLVWAKTGGWPAWPAMIDDDPDTGTFFWTEVKDGNWVAKPSYYHVVFFDEKSVSRAWISCSKLLSFPGSDIQFKKMADRKNIKLKSAVAMAKQAEGDNLLKRRSKYCLARRFKGPWGPMWPSWNSAERLETSVSEEEEVDTDLEEETPEQNRINEEEDVSGATPEVETRSNEGPVAREHSLVDNNPICSGRIEEEATDMMPPDIAKDILKSLKAPRSNNISLGDDSIFDNLINEDGIPPKKPRLSPCMASAPRPQLDHLWQDSSVYTKEFSQTQPVPPSPINASFQSDTGDMNSSLTGDLDRALCSEAILTPVKTGFQHFSSSSKASPICYASPRCEVLTSTPRNVSLSNTTTPKTKHLVGGTPNSSYKKSFHPLSLAGCTTPTLKKTPIQSPRMLEGVGCSPLLSGGGCIKEVALDTSRGSNAFSADGSFMDI